VSKPVRTVGKAASERILGTGPAGARTFVAATVTGLATAVATYKLLRGGSFGQD
jgi:hypothetical protein